MKILYAGSPEAARITLELLYENQNTTGFEIAGVLSNPPTAKGRHKTPTPTPVAAFAQEKGLPVFTPDHLDALAREQIAPLGADMLVCFAYGHIFGPKFLELFPMGGINLHPSFLPKYRGCTPVQQAILEGDELLGISIQTLSLKMDAGDILKQDFVQITESATAGYLLEYSAKAGAKMILDVIKESAAAGERIKGKPQNIQSQRTWQKSTGTKVPKLFPEKSEPIILIPAAGVWKKTILHLRFWKPVRFFLQMHRRFWPKTQPTASF